MKKFVSILGIAMLGVFNVNATLAPTELMNTNRGFHDSFIFDEGGITFAVYPDGEFDFFMGNRVGLNVGARFGNVGLTFNSGFDYNPFIQYDDFGAVIQIENVPIFYDFYGRVSQIGDIDIWYRNNRVRQIGGLFVTYNGIQIGRTRGFINQWNRAYVFRPFHSWFSRPAVGYFNVWHTPYRRWYNPIRYTWYTPYQSNFRRSYASVGQPVRHNLDRRRDIYRNDHRVVQRDYHRNGRSNLERSAPRTVNSDRNLNQGRSNQETTQRAVSRNGEPSRVTRNNYSSNRNVITSQRGNSMSSQERSAVTQRGYAARNTPRVIINDSSKSTNYSSNRSPNRTEARESTTNGRSTSPEVNRRSTSVRGNDGRIESRNTEARSTTNTSRRSTRVN